MDDILEKIKSWDRCYPGNVHIEGMVDDAAAEIKRLREALAAAAYSLEYAGLYFEKDGQDGTSVAFYEDTKAARAALKGETP